MRGTKWVHPKNIGEGHKEALFADNLAELNEDPKIHWNVWQFNKQPLFKVS